MLNSDSNVALEMQQYAPRRDFHVTRHVTANGLEPNTQYAALDALNFRSTVRFIFNSIRFVALVN
jgi:hypothetical protein